MWLYVQEVSEIVLATLSHSVYQHYSSLSLYILFFIVYIYLSSFLDQDGIGYPIKYIQLSRVKSRIA